MKNLEKECSFDEFSACCKRFLSLFYKITAFRTDFFGDVFNNDTEFNYVDLLMPDPTRSKYFILQLTRFYTFKCERMVEVEGIATELVKIEFLKNSLKFLRKNFTIIYINVSLNKKL